MFECVVYDCFVGLGCGGYLIKIVVFGVYYSYCVVYKLVGLGCGVVHVVVGVRYGFCVVDYFV